MENTELFNKIIFRLIRFIKETFPDDGVISNYEIKLKIGIYANPEIAQNMFIKYVLPYSKQINNCDENFFLKEFKDLFKDESFLDFDRLWKLPENTTKNKAKIFKYFITLLDLCK